MHGSSKAHHLDRLKARLKGKSITSHDLYMALRAFGFYRAHAADLFGYSATMIAGEIR